MGTEEKSIGELLKEHFGSHRRVNVFLDKIFSIYITSDEFAEQSTIDRKNDVFNFHQLIKLLEQMENK